jgi:hypothetical protein
MSLKILKNGAMKKILFYKGLVMKTTELTEKILEIAQGNEVPSINDNGHIVILRWMGKSFITSDKSLILARYEKQYQIYKDLNNAIEYANNL